MIGGDFNNVYKDQENDAINVNVNNTVGVNSIRNYCTDVHFLYQHLYLLYES